MKYVAYTLHFILVSVFITSLQTSLATSRLFSVIRYLYRVPLMNHPPDHYIEFLFLHHIIKPHSICAEPIIATFPIGSHIADIRHISIIKNRVTTISTHSHKYGVVCTVIYQKYVLFHIAVHGVVDGNVRLCIHDEVSFEARTIGFQCRCMTRIY